MSFRAVSSPELDEPFEPLVPPVVVDVLVVLVVVVGGLVVVVVGAVRVVL